MTRSTPNKSSAGINNLEELNDQISNLRRSLKIQEMEFAGRLEKLPQETAKAAVNALLPSAVSGIITGKSLGLITTAIGFLTGKQHTSKTNLLQTAAGVLKSAGILAALKGFIAIRKKRKLAAKNTILEASQLTLTERSSDLLNKKSEVDNIIAETQKEEEDLLESNLFCNKIMIRLFYELTGGCNSKI